MIKGGIGKLKILRYSCLLCAIVFGFATIVATGGGGGGGGSGSGGGGTGTLALNLADDTIDGCKAVIVTIDGVKVHLRGGKWKTVTATNPNRTHDLLELQNGVREELGIARLESGHYTQMRLLIGDTPDAGYLYANYTIDENDVIHELKIPSGYQTGIKIVHGFNINTNRTTELILDFGASESLVMPGHNREWLLKPTIKVVDTDNYSVISGTVTNGGLPVEGALVSAQIYNNSTASAEDRVIVQAITVTETDGSYSIFLEPNIYNVVAYLDEYDPACEHNVSAAPSGTYPDVDLTLSSGSWGEVSGTVMINGGNPEQHVKLSFRQSRLCGSETIEMEIKSRNVANGGAYGPFILPVGEYTLVATTDDGRSQIVSFEVNQEELTEVSDIIF